ncbi:hypothetical protein N7468_008390 [Penicillium chermesinum]|uniref:Uncharacterized protein n=1 Tax=Penicillium chermesinum TaxID=63820 RepID=A0A9W9TIE5_9EURO|nr:uncharacterized protein N7468_008390 [Penicillium chermesinum]KAJ5223848.1 hypothetical protein N7468_008390 [Penicillium chermesinum]KAJ6155325.1 hypothetical protein N7470_005891 [Penicillium chermesinum]
MSYARMHDINTLLLTTFVSAVAVLAFWLPSSLRQRVRWGSRCLLISTSAMAYASLCPTSVVELFGVRNFTNANGVLSIIQRFTTLLGTPLARLLLRRSPHSEVGPRSYDNTRMLVGVLLITATFAVLWTKIEAR